MDKKESLPYILIIDDDPQVLRAIRRDIRKKYKANYRIQSTASASEALEFLKELKRKNDTVALFVSDQKMPEMLGVEFLAEARELFPLAKRILLTAYSDTNAAIQGINNAQLDYYLLKPWDPPEEKLYPILDDQLGEWEAVHKPLFKGVRLLGYQWSPRSHKIKDFLSGNLISYQFLDVESGIEGRELMAENKIANKDLPAVFFEDGSYLLNPELPGIADKMGLAQDAREEMYDVVIIGAGPAGLAAAVYGGSEGLRTLMIERRAPGGQAGTSSRIENYLGFPSGLSGADLARRAITQARRFKTEFLAPQEVVDIQLQGKYKQVLLANGSEINTKSVILTTGVDYRKLEAPGVADFSGAGVYYGAATTEASACASQDVYIVGGGNSAGQGAMYLSNFARDVYLLIRRESLKSSMSQYLIEQIEKTPNIHLLAKTEVAEAMGEGRLTHLKILNRETQEEKTVEAAALFIFIGARPYTDWLPEGVVKNERGFVETGQSLHKYEGFPKLWKLNREPFMLETSQPGIFAAGDVRAGAMNRVASAVGEGAMAIKFVHQYLAEL
jgi:thioredoxin reductase (NADPH)